MPSPGVDAASSKPRGKRRPTREVILDAAIELMVAKGVGATSVEEIAQRAGCQRVTVYTHFGSKDGLALSALETLIAEWAHTSSTEVGAESGTSSDVGWDRMLLEVWSDVRADESARQRLVAMLGQVRTGLGGAGPHAGAERIRAVLSLVESFEDKEQSAAGNEGARTGRPAEPEIAGRAAPTIKQVAERAGVSFKSVSRVVNDHPHVTAELRARVESAMHELGYSPNAVARTLRSASSPTVGLVIDDSEAFPYASDIIRGAQDAASELGKVLVITYVDGAPDSRSQVLGHLRQWQVEGVAYASPHHRVIQPDELLPFTPLVLVNCAAAVPGPAFAVPSEYDGGYMATKVLIDAGHERIGLISGPSEFPASHLRREGYLAALEDAGIHPDPALQLTGDWWQEGGAAAAREMMSLAQPPTGIFATNDWMAMGVYDELRSLGLRIPEDVSVVGFDNREVIAAHMRPRLTTVALPYYEMGRWAIEALHHRNTVGGQFACNLIVRDSVAGKVST